MTVPDAPRPLTRVVRCPQPGARTVEVLFPGHPAVRLAPGRKGKEDEAGGIRGFDIPS
jgi:hypothetical protein